MTGQAGVWCGPEHAFDRRKDRFHFHDHSAAAAVRFIIGDMVLVGGPVADIMDAHIDQPALAGALKDAAFKIRGKDFRQEREDVELHASILAASGMSDKRMMAGLTPVCTDGKMIACTCEVRNGICAGGDRRINWFLVVVLVILIAIVTYVDRFVLPTAQTPFMPTPTVTRDPEVLRHRGGGLVYRGETAPVDRYLHGGHPHHSRMTRPSISPWHASRSSPESTTMP